MAKRIVFNSILLILSYLTAITLKNEPFNFVFTHYIHLFVCFIAFFFISSEIIYSNSIKSNNFKRWGKKDLFDFFKSWLISSVLLFSVIFIFGVDNLSRFVILGFILTFLCLKTIFILIKSLYYRSINIAQEVNLDHVKVINDAIQFNKSNTQKKEVIHEGDHQLIFDLIHESNGIDVIDFIKKNITNYNLQTDYHFSNSMYSLLKNNFISKNIVVLSKINDIRTINKFFEVASVKLEQNGIFICCAVTNETRKRIIKSRFPFLIKNIMYFSYFLYKRLWPKLPYLKRAYFSITKGSDRALSHAEVLGRLYSCGFEYINHTTINELTWYAMKKTCDPFLDFSPTYGPLIRLKRVGKNGDIINVFKLRTMHPYSEYIQEYVYKKNDIENEGKFKDDFRVSTAGKIFRKFWLDEIPMIINIFKGDLKIVGVRPLSKHYFSLYPEDIQQLRIKFKPGLFPPYYVDMPKSFDEIIESEKKYLLLYSKCKFGTDFRYFFIILFNIIFKRARSK